MKKETKNYINVSDIVQPSTNEQNGEKPPISNDMDGEAFLKNKDSSNIPHNKPQTYSKADINRINVFRDIELNEPTTIYQISKRKEMAYNTVSYIVRDLLHAGIVVSHMEINDNNVACKVLTIPKIKEEPKVLEDTPEALIKKGHENNGANS